jgi:hypothetical protein
MLVCVAGDEQFGSLYRNTSQACTRGKSLAWPQTLLLCRSWHMKWVFLLSFPLIFIGEGDEL